MKSITVTQLYRYPLKSGRGMPLEEIAITPRGFQYDRHWALFDEEGQVITARDFPKLLRLTPNITSEGMELVLDSKVVLQCPATEFGRVTQLHIFSQPTEGSGMVRGINDWFSNYLGIKCSLFFMSETVARPVLEKYNGKPGQVVSFADVAPILLISEASLADLNSRLNEPVTMQHFRPNMVVSGCDAFDEDNWSSVKIGDCTFDVVEPCKRCVFTTIDPGTLEKRGDGEPLRTLATYRKHPRGGGVAFGVLLAPCMPQKEMTTPVIATGNELHFTKVASKSTT